MTKGNMQVRVVTLAILVTVAFALLGTRLWYLQVLSGEKYLAQANGNRVREIKIEAPRGEIVDRAGKPLISNRSSWQVRLDSRRWGLRLGPKGELVTKPEIKTPYDLKVTVYPKNWNDSNPTSLSLEKKKELAADLYTNGDSLRERLQAKNVPNWGYNRMYILVRNDEDWLNKPELLLDTLCNQLQNNYQSFPVNVGDTEIQMCLIEI